MITQSLVKNPRELKLVGALWLLLMAIALVAVILLRQNAYRILYHLEYVAVNRYAQSMALFAEAEKRAAAVLEKRGKLNAATSTPAAVPTTDADFQAADSLFHRAMAMDPRDRFVPDHEREFTIWGDMLGAGGLPQRQLVAYSRSAMARGDLRAADEQLTRSVALNHADADTTVAIAQLAYTSGRKNEVAAILATLGPGEKWPVDAHTLQGRVYQETGNLDGAIQHYLQALPSAQLPIDIYKRLAAVYAVQGKLDDAIQALEKGRPQGGNSDGNYLNILGDLLRLRGRSADAVKVLEEGARLEPNSGDLQLSLARAYHAAGQIRRADRAMQRATALSPALQGQLLEQN